MKILYAVQATGNGHISRAMEILPTLQRYGRVDLFLSGDNHSLSMQAPVKYRSRGVSFFYNRLGSLDYAKTVLQFSPLRVMKEARDLPVEKYDLVINDFECITSLACAFKKVPSVNFGHQASFLSPNTPRPERKEAMGEWILKHYAKATQYIGLHFKEYDNFILPPIIRKDVIQAEPRDKGYITVYLPSFNDSNLLKYFAPLKDQKFQVFSKEISQPVAQGNILFQPVNKAEFLKSMAGCSGIITSAGFETPAEALYLGKKLLSIPIKGQYEQKCNAAALEKMGITIIQDLDESFSSRFRRWIAEKNPAKLVLNHSTEASVSFLMHTCTQRNKYDLDLLYPEFTFN